MADINLINELIQARVGNDTAAFNYIIENAIFMVWSELSWRFDLDFLKAPEPQSITMVAGQKIYSLKQNTGRMRYIANADGKQVWTYVPWRTFQEYCSEATGTPSVFTDYGKYKGEQQIRVESAPVSSEVFYLHHNVEGTKANFNLLPDAWIKTIIHGVLSILAPPQEKRTPQGYVWWKAVTADEDKLYESGIRRLLLSSIISPEIPVNRLDTFTENRLKEINQT